MVVLFVVSEREEGVVGLHLLTESSKTCFNLRNAKRMSIRTAGCSLPISKRKEGNGLFAAFHRIVNAIGDICERTCRHKVLFCVHSRGAHKCRGGGGGGGWGGDSSRSLSEYI